MLDIDLVNKIKNNEEADESIAILLQKHLPLLIKISSKYAKPLYKSGSSLEEIQREKEFIVYKAAMTFDDKRKIKFSSYLGTYTRWYCLNKINENNGWELISEYPIDTIPEKPKTSLENNIAYIQHLITKFNDERLKEIFQLRYFSGNKIMSWGTIGKKLGCSGQHCINLHKKGLKLLSSRAVGESDL